MNLSELIKELWKPLERPPGWVYLAFAIYIAVRVWELPWLPDELWAAILTPVFYWIGNGIDAALFRRRDGNERFQLSGLYRARKEARDALCVQVGAYDVMMKLLAESGKPWSKAAVHIQNEIGKFFRGAATPVFVLGVYLGFTRHPGFFVLIALSALLPAAAFRLKLGHMRTLYRLAPWRLPGYAVSDTEIQGGDSVGQARLFFWDGKFITSAMLEKNEARRTGTAVLVSTAAANPADRADGNRKKRGLRRSSASRSH